MAKGSWFGIKFGIKVGANHEKIFMMISSIFISPVQAFVRN